ncbi:unnamed protein product [Rotaria sordida]|uniref:Sodium-coupled monocarboxylate transporter 1 n=2 Tax=Rotaria sordida TaxID=392033 RepID=A0A815J0Z2_9BILA|nr:unnamed protein product [Rotaria sordida]
MILLLLSAIIGGIFGFGKSKKASAKEYLLADGKMHVFPTALSIMVSFVSAITLLGTPSEVYMSGTMFLYQAASWSIASMVTALIFVPKFREMNLTSIYEYLEKRFDRSIRMCVFVTYSVYMFLYMALVLYAPSLALSQTTGLNKWLSVISIGVVCTFYSAAVFGGFKRAFSIASQGGRIEFDNVSLDPRTRHTVWSILIGNSIYALLIYGFNQVQVQRYMCVRSTRGAQAALLINIIGVTSLILLTGLMGVILYAYYVDCDPYTAGHIQNVDQIFPYFIMDTLGNKKGIPGLASQLWIFFGAQLTKNQRSSGRLPLSVANCTNYNRSALIITSTTTAITHIKSNPLLGLYSVSYMWYTLIAIGSVLIVGVLVSYLTHPLKPDEIDPKLIIRMSDVCRFCCWSQQRQKQFKCVVYDEVAVVQEESKDTDIPLTMLPTN